MTPDDRSIPAPEGDMPDQSGLPGEPDVPDESLDGHTMDELAEYLRRGRQPADPSIEGSASCRLALANMSRLSELTARSLQEQAESEPGRDDVWIAGLLETIRSEVVSGRDIPIAHPDPTLHLTITEAAVRGLIRRVGDTTGGIIMGRCALHGDVAVPGEVIRIEATCALEFGLPIEGALDLLRERIREALVRHTELVVGEIDITVDDVYPRGEGRA